MSTVVVAKRTERQTIRYPLFLEKKNLNFQRKFKEKSNSYCWVKTKETSRALLSFFKFVTEIAPKRKQLSEGWRQMLMVHTLWTDVCMMLTVNLAFLLFPPQTLPRGSLLCWLEAPSVVLQWMRALQGCAPPSRLEPRSLGRQWGPTNEQNVH